METLKRSLFSHAAETGKVCTAHVTEKRTDGEERTFHGVIDSVDAQNRLAIIEDRLADGYRSVNFEALDRLAVDGVEFRF